ncbi:hypothetical protein BY996DRAFT_6430968 [Phakopsora pachyrhizi]|uniref:CHCH domain-containing protein n=1 Tax=Phakopsora pachyrhizi TaxID=170000 RepID=A0AAV0BL82_PHAPC|nr:hypothetical protein BY996DRAFT_6430968 [Phakopsora pachyrhizi]CAH7686909.1 hypothetical protein PPACK8108_LOCUS21620 [Phakopsora pachyrhizi]
MPRRSSSSGGSRSNTRSASTTSHHQPVKAGPPSVPHQQSSVPATQQQQPSSGPGLFGQMASTAAGVAVGHTMGQGLSSMLFGGGSSREEAPVAAAAPVSQQTFDGRAGPSPCEASAKDFTRCMEGTSNDFNSCSYYLDQLKACQQMFQQQH